MLRPVTKLTRYMSKQGYLDGLDDALLLICEDKLQDSAVAMVAQHKACLKKLGERSLRLACPFAQLLSVTLCSMPC